MGKLTSLVYRGNNIESVHEIKCYIQSINSEKIFSTNNDNDLIYPRSSIKIFQSIPFLNSNAVNLFKLNKKQITLSCSSHCGEKFHLRELIDWFNKTKLKLSDIKCGIHNPLNKISSENLFLSGHRPNKLHNNCAGKHLAMLSSCLAHNYPIKNYLSFDHPHQKNIREIFTIFTEKKILQKNYGIDGCSAPQYAFKIKEIATALFNLLMSYEGKFEFSKVIKNTIESILSNPKFIGGSHNLDSNLIKISNKSLFCKGGAEGVFLFINLKKRIVGVLKVKDGNERVIASALYELSKKFGILEKHELSDYNSWNDFNLYNHAKFKIGNIKTIIE